MLLTILLIVLILFLVGGLPNWYGPSYSYGYYPSGIFFVIIVIVIILALTGHL